jgi:hypothetical protein
MFQLRTSYRNMVAIEEERFYEKHYLIVIVCLPMGFIPGTSTANA